MILWDILSKRRRARKRLLQGQMQSPRYIKSMTTIQFLKLVWNTRRLSKSSPTTWDRWLPKAGLPWQFVNESILNSRYTLRQAVGGLRLTLPWPSFPAIFAILYFPIWGTSGLDGIGIKLSYVFLRLLLTILLTSKPSQTVTMYI